MKNWFTSWLMVNMHCTLCLEMPEAFFLLFHCRVDPDKAPTFFVCVE